ASCFDGEGLVAAAFAVLVSAGGGSDFARAVPAALCPRFAAEAAGFDFDAEASAGWVAREAAPWSSGLEPNRLLEKLPTPPRLRPRPPAPPRRPAPTTAARKRTLTRRRQGSPRSRCLSRRQVRPAG